MVYSVYFQISHFLQQTQTSHWNSFEMPVLHIADLHTKTDQKPVAFLKGRHRDKDVCVQAGSEAAWYVALISANIKTRINASA